MREGKGDVVGEDVVEVDDNGNLVLLLALLLATLPTVLPTVLFTLLIKGLDAVEEGM